VTNYKQLTATEAGVEVRGIALLNDLLYVIRKNLSQIDVLQPTTLKSVRNYVVPGMTDPGSMAACASEKVLYITCFRKKEVIKINVGGVCVVIICVAREGVGAIHRDRIPGKFA